MMNKLILFSHNIYNNNIAYFMKVEYNTYITQMEKKILYNINYVKFLSGTKFSLEKKSMFNSSSFKNLYGYSTICPSIFRIFSL